ncbi:MAG: glucosamine-6-phosphate deaminase [Firmicutes bacterium]|nr:glucosamine-6-phosphate deaminase [Bacillota bacterium]
MRVMITESVAEMDRAAARIIEERIRGCPGVVLGLPTGRTPSGMYREVARLHAGEGLDFSNVTTFNVDELCGLPPGDPRSFSQFMRRHLFDHVNIPAGNIHVPDGSAGNLVEACRSYEEAIEKAGGIDLLVLGIGLNGHIGFNEPGTELGSVTHVVRLSETTRERLSGFTTLDAAPDRGITMGIKTIMRARMILLLACGRVKARILRQALCGPVTPDCPASILQIHPVLTVIADRNAWSECAASPGDPCLGESDRAALS